MEKLSKELITKAEISDLIIHMLDCLLNESGKKSKCKNCNCVDACCRVTEAVFICRSKKIKTHESCF